MATRICSTSLRVNHASDLSLRQPKQRCLRKISRIQVSSLHRLYSESLKQTAAGPCTPSFTTKCTSAGAAPVTSASLQSVLANSEVPERNLDQVIQETAESLAGNLQGSNIFLVGMMGCGKSTVGRILSDALGYAFFDSDTMIEKAVGSSVSTIFQEQGEPAFRELEVQAILQLAGMEGLVVATGGGVILKDENWKQMRTGSTVWIDVPLKDLAQRVVSAGIGSRPILSAASSFEADLYSQAFNRLNSVFANREHLYKKSDVRVSLHAMAGELGTTVSDLQPKLIALQILLSLKDHLLSKFADEDASILVSSEFQPIQEVAFGLGLPETETAVSQEPISSQ